MITVADVDLEVQLYGVANQVIEEARATLTGADLRAFDDTLTKRGILPWVPWPRSMVMECARDILAALPDDPALAAARARLERLIAQADGQLSLF